MGSDLEDIYELALLLLIHWSHPATEGRVPAARRSEATATDATALKPLRLFSHK